MTSTDQLMALLRERYNTFDADRTEIIDTHALAEAVYADLDPSFKSPPLVMHAAILELKQLARSICRMRQVQEEHNSEQQGLFEFRLQPRYPACREGRDVYVLREYLSLEERSQNIQRLRSEGTAKNTHADALEAETNDLIRQGKLSAAVSA